MTQCNIPNDGHNGVPMTWKCVLCCLFVCLFVFLPRGRSTKCCNLYKARNLKDSLQRLLFIYICYYMVDPRECHFYFNKLLSGDLVGSVFARMLNYFPILMRDSVITLPSLENSAVLFLWFVTKFMQLLLFLAMKPNYRNYIIYILKCKY